jgi:hypothetical protein
MRFTHRSMFAPLSALALLALASGPVLACSSCGCTLSSDWLAEGGYTGGFHAEFRFDYFNQDQLRSGTGRVDRGGITFPADREIQQLTINRNYNLFVDYAPDADWGITAHIPYFDRYHTTIVAGDEDVSTSHTKSVGDVRILGRYRGFASDRSVGVQFGLKLATGSFHNNFISGPQEGAALDRGLQPGTGTTDLVLGIYKFGSVNRDWNYFAQALVQQPLNSREDFRPGAGLNVTLGARYAGFERVMPQVQLNIRTERRESGLNADVENSGATLVYLSPGVNVNLSPSASAYAYLQIPIYQRVNGFQIEPRYSASVGMRFAL